MFIDFIDQNRLSADPLHLKSSAISLSLPGVRMKAHCVQVKVSHSRANVIFVMLYVMAKELR